MYIVLGRSSQTQDNAFPALSLLHSWSVEIPAPPDFGWQVPGLHMNVRGFLPKGHFTRAPCTPWTVHLVPSRWLFAWSPPDHEEYGPGRYHSDSKDSICHLIQTRDRWCLGIQHRYPICEATSISHAFLSTVFSLPFIIIKLCWLTRESKRVSRGPLFSLAIIFIEGGWYILTRAGFVPSIGSAHQVGLPGGGSAFSRNTVALDQQAFWMGE